MIRHFRMDSWNISHMMTLLAGGNKKASMYFFEKHKFEKNLINNTKKLRLMHESKEAMEYRKYLENVSVQEASNMQLI